MAGNPVSSEREAAHLFGESAYEFISRLTIPVRNRADVKPPLQTEMLSSPFVACRAQAGESLVASSAASSWEIREGPLPFLFCRFINGANQISVNFRFSRCSSR